MLYEGGFYGYREVRKPPGGARRGWHPSPVDPPIRLKWFHWELLGPLPFDWRIFSGTTGDNFQDSLVSVGFDHDYSSRAVLAHIREAPAQIIFSNDGETENDMREFQYGFIRLEAIRGFKIRSAYVGIPSRYQFMFLR